MKTTAHGAAFDSGAKITKVFLVIWYFLEGIFCLLRALFLALKVLRFCVSNQPAMIFIFVHHYFDSAFKNLSIILAVPELYSNWLKREME